MSLESALARISQIHAELAPLHGVRATPPAPASSSASFAGVLAAQTASFAPSAAPLAAASAASAPFAPAAALPAATAGWPVGGVAVSALQLPPRAAELMTAGQRQFAVQLAAETGLDAQVVAAWMLAEQSSGAAVAREQAGNHNWLNIGYTDSATYGASAAVWRDPASAASATAGWLKGAKTVDGYGVASAGVQSILTAAGQPPQAQIAALQRSGWASSGYPDLPAVFAMLSR